VTRVAGGAERAFLIVAISLTLVLVAAAANPRGSLILSYWLHSVAHVGAFAAFAIAWTLALPKVPAPLLALAGVAVGFAHEAIEIFGHAHPFEIDDAWLDAAGVVTGVVFVRLLRRKSATPPLR
jgi:hypothetical protein